MIETISSLSQIVEYAKKECHGKPYVNNLILSAKFPISLFNEPFINLFYDDASLWQNSKKPEELHINHGSYIHKSGNGIQYLINELKSKPSSNRALLSLINMKDIINSGDTPIPSFFVTQFSIEDDDLFCTTYFRALEVSKFLPINIAEVCLIAKSICAEIHHLKNIVLCMHAFKAYHNNNFDTLKRAAIDMESRGKIAGYVHRGNKEKIKELLVSKFYDSSVIESGGTEELYNSLVDERENGSQLYSDAFIQSIGKVVRELHELREKRTNASFGAEIKSLENSIHDQIRAAIENLQVT